MKENLDVHISGFKEISNAFHNVEVIQAMA